MPDNAIVCIANEKNTLESEHAKIYFDSNSFYDDLPLTIYETPAHNVKQVSPTIHIGDYTIPVHNDYNVLIKKDAALNNSIKNNVVMQIKSGASSTIKKGVWQGDWMLSSFDKLGDVCLIADTIMPVIKPVGWESGSAFINQKTLVVKCTDDLSMIANFTAMLDGKWLMFARKNDFFIYSFDEHCAGGDHTLTITATDVAGNTTTQTFNFTKQ